MIVALDYDGVLVDSRLETFAVAYNIYQKLYGFKRLRNVILSSKNFGLIQSELKDIEKRFTELRPLCDNACLFSSLMSAIDNGVQIGSKADFEAYSRKHFDSGFRQKFHNERQRLQEEDFEAFLKLTPPHGSVIQDVKRLQEDFEIVIITGNRGDLIKKVLVRYGLDIEKVFDAAYMDVDNGKRKAVDELLERAGPEEIRFVDDRYFALKSVRGTGIRCYLADWGFESEEGKNMAKKEGMEIIKQEEFYSKVR